MGKGRLEAFSDGVIAIIITIMVLELKVPHGEAWSDLVKLGPVFLSYVLSFINVAIYWNNHHHMLHAVKRVNGAILWANMHLLFWLSLIPFSAGFMGENHFAPVPMTVYALNLLMAAVAYTILQIQIVKLHGKNSPLAVAIGAGYKEKISLASYIAAVPIALFWHSWVAFGLLAMVALIWFIPDRRIEQVLAESDAHEK
jgi:uncharacterized membrane protein